MLTLPAVGLGEAAVHAEELRGEQGRLVAAGPGADLEYGVALLVGILGRQLLLHLLLERVERRLQHPLLLGRHFEQLVSAVEFAQEIPRLIEFLAGPLVPVEELDNRVQLRQRPARVAKPRRVGKHVRIDEPGRQFVVGVLNLFQLVEHGPRSSSPSHILPR